MEQEEVEVERSIGVMEDSDELESLETRSHLSRRMADGREQDGLRRAGGGVDRGRGKRAKGWRVI